MEQEFTQLSVPGDGSVHELTAPAELIEYLEKNATSFSLTDKEAELVLGYFEGHDYMLGELNGKMLRGDLAEEEGMVWWEDYSMDDVIDMACEWNYELILEADAKRKNPEDFVNFVNSQNYYDGLKKDEVILDKLFEQTKYNVQIEDMAKKLADEFIQNLSGSNKNVSTEAITNTVQKVSEQVKQYSNSERSR